MPVVNKPLLTFINEVILSTKKIITWVTAVEDGCIHCEKIVIVQLLQLVLLGAERKLVVDVYAGLIVLLGQSETFC